jgi:pimeloyl-ACP methyl ester carboxylesterase
MSGRPVDVYSEEQKAYENELDADLEVWAPLGADDRIRELWQATPEAQGYPDEAEPAPEPAADPSRLQVPTLVIVARHDPPAQQEVGRALAREAPNAELVEIDSDHYLTIRRPDDVAEHIRRFLSAS